MPIKFKKDKAKEVLIDLITEVDEDNVDVKWAAKVTELSRLCDEGNASTHIAFLGVEMLAKAIEPKVDLYYIKPTKAPEDHLENSYSARTLCHSVLVPVATNHDVDLGVSGAEPLNNQPYFRMDYLNDGTAVHSASRPAWNYMLELVAELDKSTNDQALAALGAFIYVRRFAGITYVEHTAAKSISSLSLVAALDKLVGSKSENGKRAQAAAAGVLDAVYGSARVDTGSGKINDPSRKRPGDVCVLCTDSTEEYELSFEVKDKPVDDTDIKRFVRNALSSYKVFDFGYLALASNQPQLNDDEIINWAEERGATVSIFYNWRDFLRQAIFWAPEAALQLTVESSVHVAERLQEIEASAEALDLWNQLVGAEYNDS